MLSHKICATKNYEETCPVEQTTNPALQPHYLCMYKKYLIPSSTEKEDAEYVNVLNTLKEILNQRKQCYRSIKEAKQVSRDFNRVFEDNRVNTFINYLILHFPRKLRELRNSHCSGSGPIPKEFLKETSEEIKLCIKNINENKPLEQWDFRLFEDIIVDIYLEGRSKLNGFRFDFIFLMNKRAKESKVWDSDEFNNMKSKLLEANRSLDSLKEEYSSE